MILKVQGDFGMADFAKIIEKISPYFKFIYSNETMYIALKDYSLKQNAEIAVSKTFRPAKNHYVKEINENNILNEDESVVMWCRDNFVELDRQRFEIEQQVKLQNAWKALNNMEEILREQYKEQYKEQCKEQCEEQYKE